MSTQEPDRFTREVTKLKSKNHHGYILETNAVKLLRREHAGSRNVVRAYMKKIGSERPDICYGTVLDACQEILDALDARGK
jgi:hypothetical protein